MTTNKNTSAHQDITKPVTYDRITSWDYTGYRSEPLYRPDLRTLYTVPWTMKARWMVEIIANHGDAFWSPAILTGTEEVGDFGMLRYLVLLPDGTEHMVSQDRIRARTDI